MEIVLITLRSIFGQKLFSVEKLDNFYLRAVSSTILRTLQVTEDLGDGHAAVRVGAATTNIEMLNWSTK